MKTRILLAGETWVSSAIHVKGFDRFHSATFHSGAKDFLASFDGTPYEIEHMSGHDCAENFPDTLEALDAYAAVILSDVGANTLLLPQAVWLEGRPVPNRLKLLRDWVAGGGGLMMIGGYLTFQGIDGKARWGRTAVEETLPVTCLLHDDRLEIPEGFRPEVCASGHPILDGMPSPWPMLLGANEVVCRDRPDCELLARLPAEHGGHPLLVAGGWGKGRTLAWTSDIGPHWATKEFIAWPGYAMLWRNAIAWLVQDAKPVQEP